MQKVITILLLFTGVITAICFTEPPKEEINWITIAQLDQMYKDNPKPILINVYTDWCGWCKQMDKTTYQSNKLVSYINERYYAVKLNAESQEEFLFNKKSYQYNPQGKSNELAEFLLFRRMEFPTTVFLSAIDAQPAPLPGFMKAREMEAPLKYFGSDAHRKQSFVEFNETMKRQW